MKMRRILVVLTIFYSLGGMAQSSVLAEGMWYRIGITETGIHKIDRNTLSALGIPEGINPKALKLYGNDFGGTLPQANEESRPIDLIENAIFIRGESDNSFDEADYVLFFGKGPNKEHWSSEGFAYEKNIYSDTAYYFLRIDGEAGKRIANKPNVAGTATLTVSSFDDHIVFEEDKTNLISSGRGWYGERLTSGDAKGFSHQIDGLSSDVNITLSGVSQSSEESQFVISADGANVGSFSLDQVPDGPGTLYSIKAEQATASFSFSPTPRFNLNIRFNGNASGERGFIDYYFLTFRRALRLYNNETKFRWKDDVGQLIRYEIAGASNVTIWDVTNPTEPKNQAFNARGEAAVFQSQSSQVEAFVAFSGEGFPTPFVFGPLANQNLRGSTGHDGIIVTNHAFKNQADQLAQFHRDHDGLDVKVVSTREVYNEFSSGRQDVSAIRDYAKHVYEKGGQLKYLLLFGDCSYDYKERVLNNTNFVPTYQSRNSFHPIFSYSSDDYFGFLENDEGIWEETISGDHTLEIGVGRLPAKTPEEAQAMVDKIMYYSTSPNTLGPWRNEIAYVGDDGDGNIHAQHVEALSKLIDTAHAQYKINKILLDAFDQESNGSTERSPQAVSAFETQIKSGAFSVNYIGHGNERLLMKEEILTKSAIEQLTNRNKLPIFVTATCEFGRYDNPILTSGAEDLLLLEQGGAIALLTTSRPVFASTNFSLNQAFHENIFRKENGENLRLGDVIRLTKNEGLEGPVNRNFTLLGDPMMMPAYPKLAIELDNLGTELDTLSALEKVTFTGSIMSGGSIQSDFNGRLLVGVYDLEQSFNTKGQESDSYTYTLRSNALFRGEASVVDGRFSVSFMVPKNISYQNKPGKISLYAWDKDGNQDAGGSNSDVIIGGTADSTPDNEPPIVNLYLNDSSFVSGGLVGQSPLLIAQIADDSGITTARSGVVEGIVLDFQGERFNLNDFYTASIDDFTKGTVVFPLQNLESGNYTATLKVWDTHNNASEREIAFQVSDDPIIYIFNPIVYPNPVIDQTTFSFEHDREDEDLLVTLFVYGPHGNVVNNTTYEIDNSSRRIEIPWRPNLSSGSRLNRGIYYSRLVIKSKLDGAVKEISQKLVIRNR